MAAPVSAWLEGFRNDYRETPHEKKYTYYLLGDMFFDSRHQSWLQNFYVEDGIGQMTTSVIEWTFHFF